MHDVLTNLKRKLTKVEKQYQDENLQLTEEFRRITMLFKELQDKSKWVKCLPRRRNCLVLICYNFKICSVYTTLLISKCIIVIYV